MRAGLQTEVREEAGETLRSCPACSKFVLEEHVGAGGHNWANGATGR